MATKVPDVASMPTQQLPTFQMLATLDRVTKLMTRTVGEIARAHDATSTQLMVIATLAETPEGMRAKELSSALGIRPGSLTGTLDTLQDRGFIERVRVANDRRQQQIVLLPKAQELTAALAEAEAALHAAVKSFGVSQLNHLDQQVQGLEQSLLGLTPAQTPATTTEAPAASASTATNDGGGSNSTRDRVISISSRVLSAVDAVRRLRDD